MSSFPYREKDLICENLSYSEDGQLMFAGRRLAPLAEKYGTPAYIMDEDRIRDRCRTYLGAVRDAFGENGRVFYASKAASFKRIYEIMAEEGMGADVVSSGEIYTASLAGFPLGKAMFHSNNKTDSDIEFGIRNGIGHFVCDNTEEVDAVSRIAGMLGVTQKILLRITPGIDPHTYAAVSTGKVDSKFGSAVETGQATEITRHALASRNIILDGFHCHIGSQVFSPDVYLRTVDVMLGFVRQIRDTLGYECSVLDIGGGFGVRYTSADPYIDIASGIAAVGAEVRNKVSELGIRMPVICFEPGRSIVADAGLTLYTVGTVKKIPGYKNYVSVDGGMTDNIRHALYSSPYTVIPVTRPSAERDMSCSVVGRCCESGDILAEDVMLPGDTGRGDILACLTTGAYHYSMSSNYNRIPRPPVIMISGESDYVAVRRETFEDLTRLDV